MKELKFAIRQKSILDKYVRKHKHTTTVYLVKVVDNLIRYHTVQHKLDREIKSYILRLHYTAHFDTDLDT